MRLKRNICERTFLCLAFCSIAVYSENAANRVRRMTEELQVIKFAIKEEVDPFEIPKEKLLSIISKAEKNIEKLSGLSQDSPDFEKLAVQTQKIIDSLPAKPFPEILELNGWKSTKPKIFWIEEQKNYLMQPFKKGVVLCTDRRLRKKMPPSACKPMLLKTLPRKFGKFNRLSMWIYPKDMSYQHLDIGAAPSGVNPVFTDTDRNHWLKYNGWNRVIWDYHYHNEDYKSLMERFCFRVQINGLKPGDPEIAKYYISSPVLLRVKARKFNGWQPDPTLIIVPQEGYKPIGSKKALLSPDIKEVFFELWDTDRKTCVLKKALNAKTTVTGKYLEADFSDFEKKGNYEIRAGKLKSPPFRIAEDNIKPALDACMFFMRCNRIGCESPYSVAVCTDDARRLDNGKHQDFSGGWFDAGDVYQVPANTSKVASNILGVYSSLTVPYKFTSDPVKHYSNIMLRRKRLLSPYEEPDYKGLWKDNCILDEARWGLEWLLKMQGPNGGVYWGQRQNDLTKEQKDKMIWGWYVQSYFTDNIIGTWDDKWWNVIESPPGYAGTPSFMNCMAEASRFFRKKDKEFSEKLIKASKKACEYYLKEENLSSAISLGYSIIAFKNMFLATGEDKYRKKTIEHASKLLELQCLNLNVCPKGKVSGFFFVSKDKQGEPLSYIQQAHMPYIALSEICRDMPNEKEWIKWYAALKIASKYYFKNICAFHAPYFNMPGGLFCQEQLDNPYPRFKRQLSAYKKEKYEKLGKFFLRHMPGCAAQKSYTWPRGWSAHISNTALALFHMARAENSPETEELARLQLGWILGYNPFGITHISGVGYDPILGMSGSAYIPGKVSMGGVSWDLNSHSPFFTRNARIYHMLQWKEGSVVQSGTFIEAAGIYSQPPLLSGSVRSDRKAASNIKVEIYRDKSSGAELVKTLESNSKGNFGPCTLNAGGKYLIKTGDIEIPFRTVSGTKYEFPINLDSEISVKIEMPEKLIAGKKCTLKAKIKGMGKKESEHCLELRLFNLETDRPKKSFSIAPGEKKIIKWEIMPLKGSSPFVAVLVPDGQLGKREEIIGEINKKKEK